jgi:hypothetical protein
MALFLPGPSSPRDPTPTCKHRTTPQKNTARGKSIYRDFAFFRCVTHRLLSSLARLNLTHRPITLLAIFHCHTVFRNVVRRNFAISEHGTMCLHTPPLHNDNKPPQTLLHPQTQYPQHLTQRLLAAYHFGLLDFDASCIRHSGHLNRVFPFVSVLLYLARGRSDAQPEVLRSLGYVAYGDPGHREAQSALVKLDLRAHFPSYTSQERDS